MNFSDSILVKMNPDDDFIAITTYDIRHGKSSRFLLHKADMLWLVADERESLLDSDLDSFLQIHRDGQNAHFKLTWISRDFRDEITGYVHHFTISVRKLQQAINGQHVHHIEHCSTEKAKAKLSFSDGASRMLQTYRQDKLSRHALRTFFRDNFNYGQQEHLRIYPDSMVKGFYFQNAKGYDGGIVQHESTVIGKDGKEHRRVFYAVHT